MKFNLLVALLGCLLAPTIAIPTTRSLQTFSNNTALSERGIPAWRFYYNDNAGQHQTNYNQLSSTGYRMISLSAYGQPPNHHYAAVWVQRTGYAYFAIHDANAAQYQSFFNTHAANGYVSTIITATGPSNGAIFAGVMEKNGVTNWYQKCSLTHDDYIDALIDGGGNGYILQSFTEYGTSSDRRFCGVWYYNVEQITQPAFVDESYSDYQATVNLVTQAPGWHPGYLAISEDHLISSAFVGADVGSWVARHGLTASTLQTEYQTQLAAGRYIIHLQGGGTGGNINFAAIWAERDIPI
ncbi:hypothetical protein GALMADRAFT_244932 [Galerina marginata CBS 339.88]|uniref:Uncharacterized protein n=1 Tax=Galerina marginata (strain CBS 339.88) TaxID=685588 RepID=A0A067T494_GALM3|nr:hypothetical protein GALMADRAFT_244932 [Galerina marginata CBS 339.88]